MTEVFSAYFQEEALVLKTLLDSAGIDSEILAGSMTELAPFYNINNGGYRLIVADEDAEDAAALVAEHRRLKAERKEIGEDGGGERES